MHEFLWQTFHRLIAEVETHYQRFLYPQLNVKHRLTGIIGPRGVGKTTLMLQYIKNHFYETNQAFYFSADNIYFNEFSIISLVESLYQRQGIEIFFIDEIHQYPNWAQEIKNIYDSFPKIKIIFSGSSSIDLAKGTYDLSRRVHLLCLPGLSFREYMNIKLGHDFKAYSLDEIITNHQKLATDLSKVAPILQHFEEYRLFGYYPIVFEGKDEIYNKLAQVIEKTVVEDIANSYNLKTSNLNYFKRILNFLASSPPGEIKTNNLARHTGIDNKTVDHYLMILEKTGLVKMLYPMAHGHQTLTKPAKVYIDNTTLLAAINIFLSEEISLGTQRELVFLQSMMGAKQSIFYPHVGDFQVGDIIFEIGGKNKKDKHVTHLKKILVKDNMLVGFKDEIPLYLFGFLY